MKRLITDKLIAWKNDPNHKPLIIYGARQIGKTYTVLEFGNAEYDNVVYCNFESDKQLSALFIDTLDPKTIIANLDAYYSTSISRGNTLVF